MKLHIVPRFLKSLGCLQLRPCLSGETHRSRQRTNRCCSLDKRVNWECIVECNEVMKTFEIMAKTALAKSV